MPIGAKLYESAQKSEDGAAKEGSEEDKKEEGPVEGEVIDEEKEK